MSYLFESLRGYKEKNNRGVFADLRCYLVPSKRQKAWPVLNRLNVAIDDTDSAFTAAWYATHPEESLSGNFGTVCRCIGESRNENKGSNDKLSPTERRFQQLLASEKRELPARITRFILAAKSAGIPVNYEQLRKDISLWGDRVKTEWASEFWIPGTPAEDEGENV